MAHVQFTVSVDFDESSRVVWDEMIDWKGHETWIPATRVEIDGDDPSAVGSTFTAWTGPGPLALEDRMQVSECAWDDDTDSGVCEVEKLGPVLAGRAGFTVEPISGGGSRVDWFEDVTVPRVPQALAPVVGRLAALGFRFGMSRLNRKLSKQGTTAAG